jgi:hypothetical protein
VKVQIELPRKYYDFLLGRVTVDSREYALLRSGVIPENNTDLLLIACEETEANLLLRLARQLCPEAVPYIEKAISQPT